MLKKHKSKIIAGIIIVVSLIVAFFADSEISKAPYNQNINEAEIEKTLSPPEMISTEIITPQEESFTSVQKEQEIQPEEIKEIPKEPESIPVTDKITEIEPVTEKPAKTDSDAKKTEEVIPIIEDTEKTESVIKKTEKIDPVIEDVSKHETDKTDELTCTLSVRCDTILENVSLLKKEKRELLPQNGVIYPKQTVTFSEGESIFDLLVREMRENKIHLEFVKTPGINSAYIEGIGNFYEFDCGDLSGWMCKVNGQFLKTGPSNYILKDNDNVEWVYTCDLGKDVGESYAK